MSELAQVKDLAISRFLSRDYVSLDSLSKELNVNYNTMRDWLYKKDSKGESVKLQRSRLESDIKKEARQRAVKELTETYKTSAQLSKQIAAMIQDSIDKGDYDPKDYPTLLSTMGSFLRNVHGTIRLEEGESTQNLAVQGNIDVNSVQGALEAIKNDPFSPFKETLEISTEE